MIPCDIMVNFAAKPSMKLGKEFDRFRERLLDDYQKAFEGLSPSEGSNSCRPSEAAIMQAWRLLAFVKASSLPAPKVVPSLEGGVGICFAHAGKYADLECFNSDEVLGVVSDRRGNVDVFDIMPLDARSVQDAISKISRFLRPTERAMSHTAAGPGR